MASNKLPSKTKLLERQTEGTERIEEREKE
jgi:hypothetical protein